jgi:hypothetical protein
MIRAVRAGHLRVLPGCWQWQSPSPPVACQSQRRSSRRRRRRHAPPESRRHASGPDATRRYAKCQTPPERPRRVARTSPPASAGSAAHPQRPARHNRHAASWRSPDRPGNSPTPVPNSSTSPETSKPGLKGGCWLLLILAAGDQAIGEIDAAGADPDAHLARTRARFGKFLQPQRGWTGQFMADDGSHAGKFSIVAEKSSLLVARDGKGLCGLACLARERLGQRPGSGVD